MAYDSGGAERPRAEPEIIPPDRTGRGSDWLQRTWRPYVSNAAGTHRVYVTRLGPFGFMLLMLIVALIFAVVIFLAVIGAVLIWLPVAAIVVLIAALSGLQRRRRP
jgi:type IV secretory pathway VirB6-like protein